MKKSPLIQLIRYTRDDRSKILWASFYSVINKIFDIAPEILIGVVIDVVVRKEKSFLADIGLNDPWSQILVLGVLTFIIWASESTFDYLKQVRWRGLAQTIQHKLRLDVYSHLQDLELSFFEDKSTGNLVSILNDDINQLERFLDIGANQIIQTLTAVIGVGAVFFYISPSVACMAFLPIPLIIGGSFYFQKKAEPLYADVREKAGILSARLNNNLSGILTIKSFTAEKREVATLTKESQSYMDSNSEAIAISSAFIPVIRIAIMLGFLATFLLGGYKVLQGELEVGSYGVLVFLTQRLLWPLTQLAQVADLYERAMASATRVLDLLSNSHYEKSGDHTPASIQGHFKLNNLCFSYQTGPEILKSLNIEILPGKTTAFVGSTGSGKSTLVKLLLKFYEQSQGELILDGIELSKYHTRNLRSRIGLVSQDVFLFHGTIRENIIYGNPKASETDLLKAVDLSESKEFIERLPQGLDTLIGERGLKLSGGQRQRISIARAILRDPDILILDEATSAVDNETEAAIQRALSIISQNRTTIVIAHRLSTIVNSHQIYVLENGSVKETGTHKELLSNNSTYHQLWSVQTGEMTKSI